MPGRPFRSLVDRRLPPWSASERNRLPELDLGLGMLEVRDLTVHYHTTRGAVRAVNGVSFDIKRGERFGLVAESGSDKSTIALAFLRLIRPPGKIESGHVIRDGIDL